MGRGQPQFAPLFTAPSFRTFTMLACGFLAHTGKQTVCGMLAGAGLARMWPHDRAHRFYCRASWTADELGLAVARLVAALLVPAGEPVTVAIDDTFFRRRGKKVWAAGWFHDGAAPGPAKTGYGNTWVIAAVVVKLPALRRPVAIPVLAKLVIKGTSSASRLWLARRMTQMIAEALPGCDIRVVADSAYAGGELKKLPDRRTRSPGVRHWAGGRSPSLHRRRRCRPPPLSQARRVSHLGTPSPLGLARQRRCDPDSWPIRPEGRRQAGEKPSPNPGDSRDHGNAEAAKAGD
jgi:hypothetical protein